MFRNKVIGLLIVMLIVVSVCASFAAETAKPWSIAAGVFRPQSSTLRHEIGTSWLTARLGYDVPSQLKGWASQIEVGYTEKKKSGTKFQEIPLTWNFLGKSADTKFFYGAGAGAYMCKETGEKSKTKFGMPFILGYNFTEAVNLQLRYDWVSGKVADENAGGFSLLVGTKF